MFRKISFRVLLYILGALVLMTIITQISERVNGDSSFRSEIASFDTARATGIIISDPKAGNKSIELTRTSSGGWKMISGGREYRTDDEYIKSLLWELTGMKTERIAATQKDKWKEFEVTDSLALRITVRGKSKVLADLMVGKFSFQPPSSPYDQQGKMTSYLRVHDEKEVYAVNGFIRMNLSPDINRFRDKTVVRSDAGKMTKLTFHYPADSAFIMEKQDNVWKINGIKADSASTARYLAGLANLSGNDFTDNEPVTGPTVYKLTLESTSSLPVEIIAYAGDSVNGHIITSSLNPGVYFTGKSGLTGDIFKGKFSFLK